MHAFSCFVTLYEEPFRVACPTVSYLDMLLSRDKHGTKLVSNLYQIGGTIFSLAWKRYRYWEIGTYAVSCFLLNWKN